MLGQFSNCRTLVSEKELAECVAEDIQSREFSDEMEVLFNTPYDLLPENAKERFREKMKETHDSCNYLGEDCWDCGHVDGQVGCDCHVCQKEG